VGSSDEMGVVVAPSLLHDVHHLTVDQSLPCIASKLDWNASSTKLLHLFLQTVNQLTSRTSPKYAEVLTIKRCYVEPLTVKLM